MNYHSGPRYQKGRGLGNIFMSMFRGLAPIARLGMQAGKKILSSPLAKKLGNAALDVAKTSATSLAADLVDGKNMNESMQQELEKARSKIATTLRGGRKRKRHNHKIKHNRAVKSKKIKTVYNLLD